jgi:hypothetical protein
VAGGFALPMGQQKGEEWTLAQAKAVAQKLAPIADWSLSEKEIFKKHRSQRERSEHTSGSSP